MQDLEQREHLCAQTACLSSIEGKHPGTKVSSINSSSVQRYRWRICSILPPPGATTHHKPSPTTIDWVFRVLSHSVYYSSAAMKAWLDTQTKLSLKLPLSLPVIWKRPECWSHPSRPEGALVSRERENDWDKKRDTEKEKEREERRLVGGQVRRKMTETGLKINVVFWK